MIDTRIKALLHDETAKPFVVEDIKQKNDSESVVYERVMAILKNKVQEILVARCQEDIFVRPKELEKLPYWIKKQLHSSEKRGIQLYYLIKDEETHVSAGGFGSSALRENQYYFEELIKDPRIKEKVVEYSFRLSEVLEPQKTFTERLHEALSKLDKVFFR